VLAGLVMAGWIVGEILILTGDGELISPSEFLYLGVSGAMAGLGLAVGQAAGADHVPPPTGPSGVGEGAHP